MNNIQKKLLLQMQLGMPIRGGIPGRRIAYTIDNLYYDIGRIINTWNFKDYSQVVDSIFSCKSRSFSWVKSQLFPRNFQEMHIGLSVIPKDEGQSLLLWYANYINVFRNEINDYLKYKDQFEKCFIKGDYEKAKEILTNLEETLGYSLWSIESELALNEYTGGLEKNKEYL